MSQWHVRAPNLSHACGGGTRKQVLDLLMEGAQDLSQLRPTHALMGETDSSNSNSLLAADIGPRVQGKRALVRETGSKKEAASGALSMAVGKTRRWGYRRGRAPQPTRNLFGPVAARAFFRPLVHGLWQHVGCVFDCGFGSCEGRAGGLRKL